VTQFVCKDAAGRRQGRFLSRTDAGVTVAKGGFSDDKPEGLWTFYAADGTKAAEIPIAGGVPSGDMLLYYPSGKLRGRTREIPDGKTLINETFYESGAKASVHVIDKRAGAGEYTGFHENGTKAAEGRNAGNTRQGLWREWDATGKLVVTAEYDAQGNRTSCKGPGCEAKPAAGH
jgi:antitoxin component YwqK of YwqJK toxin-antitoxin module